MTSSQLDMPSSALIHDVFHREDETLVRDLLQQLKDQCQQGRPLPVCFQHCKGESGEFGDDILSWLGEGAINWQCEYDNDEREEDEEDNILCMAREVDPSKLVNLRQWQHRTKQWGRIASSVNADIAELSAKLGSLVTINSEVAEKSTFLSKNAAALIEQKETLEHLGQGIEERLKYFEKVEVLAKEINNPKLDPYSKHFSTVLDDIDEVITFLQAHKHYKSAGTYLSRTQIVQRRALMLLRDLIIQKCTTVAQEVRQSTAFVDLTKAVTKVPPAPPVTSPDSSAVVPLPAAFVGLTEVLNAEFQAKLDGMLPLIQQLELRCSRRKESQIYLNDILTTYYECRVQILHPILAHYLQYCWADPDVPLQNLVTQGIPYLLSISVDECALFHSFFALELLGTHLKSMIEGVGLVVYEKFRALVLKQDDIQELSIVIDTLRNSLLLGKLQSAGEGGTMLSGVLHKMIQDTQERFIFRCSMYIKDVIAHYRYTYQDCLPFLRLPDTQVQCLVKGNNFPTLANTLFLLGTLSTAVERGVFEGLAQEVVRICTDALIRTADLIVASSKLSKERPEFPVLESQLFLIRHLLTLREQITPFDIHFQMVERWLDVSGLGRKQLSIQSTTRDAKKDLESHLRTACEQFIAGASEHTLSTLKSLLGNVTEDTPNDEALASLRGVPPPPLPHTRYPRICNLELVGVQVVVGKATRPQPTSPPPGERTGTNY
eukprot:NODE_136_length_2400_cov_83.625266_g94_i0.p1 GENE.NODE_136_length_2400_cov_83.625266_g94_i0~~NODE_136_length_2400_cov_83.625266_g94_i0.p1  ORF type:complete len:718 (-),score=136.80 NODE_136_length_2400_cov_83.625266_g94_i0:155-2308(-)